MTKSVFFSLLTALCLLGAGQSASAQGAITNGGAYKITHYGVPADGSAFGVPVGTPPCLDVNLGLTTAGASIGQWGDNGFDGQRYIFERQTDGSYKLRHRGTTMYVQPAGLSKAANARIEQNVLLTSGDDAGNKQFAAHAGVVLGAAAPGRLCAASPICAAIGQHSFKSPVKRANAGGHSLV